MDRTPTEFYSRTIGRAYDIDGAFGYQCWDYMAEQARSNNVPLSVIHCSKTGYVQDIWDLRHRSGILSYYDEIPAGSFRNGDMVIWGFDYPYTPKSHVAMFWNGQAVGQSQSGQKFVCTVDYLDFDKALGGFRLKAWEDTRMRIGSWQKIETEINGVTVILIGHPDGDDLTLISAKNDAGEVTGYSVQTINKIDNPHYIYDTKLNSGFFDNTQGSSTFGEAYGVRCGHDEWSVPRQGKFIYYALMKDGRSEVGLDSDFWYTPDQCQCASSPALVLMLNGADVEYISPIRSDRRTLSCVQSVLIRTQDRYVDMVSKGNLTPDQIRDWCKTNIDGLLDLVFNDGGGSACIQYGYDVITGTSELRKIANAWTAYHAKASPAQETPTTNSDDDPIILPVSEPPAADEELPIIIPAKEEEESMEEQKTIPGQVAKLIDVKSLITLSLTATFVYLAVTGQISEQQMMTIYTVIVGFYFGTQATKKGNM